MVRGVANLPEKPAEEPEAPRKDSYVSGLEMLFGKKWRSDEPESDDAARALLRTYQEGALAELEDNILPQRTGFVKLEPELTLLQYGTPWLRLRISGGGRQYVVKSIEHLLEDMEESRVVSYGKSLTFQHRWDAFTPDAQQLLGLIRREVISRKQLETRGYTYSRYAETGPAGGMALTGELFDALVTLYADRGEVGGYTLKKMFRP